MGDRMDICVDAGVRGELVKGPELREGGTPRLMGLGFGLVGAVLDALVGEEVVRWLLL